MIMNQFKMNQVLSKRRDLVKQENYQMDEVVALAQSLNLTVPELFFISCELDRFNPYSYDHLTLLEYRSLPEIRTHYNVCLCHGDNRKYLGQIWQLTNQSFDVFMELYIIYDIYRKENNIPTHRSPTAVTEISEVVNQPRLFPLLDSKWAELNQT